MNSVLITGASGGIGQAVSHLCRSRGWEPLCVGRSAQRLSERLPDFQHFESDVSDESEVTRLFEKMAALDNPPSSLVHCVGSTLVGPLDRLTLAQYQETMHVNLTTTILMTSQFIGALKKSSKPGSIVLFSSVVSRIGVANHEVISAAKAAIEGFARSAAASYASLGIRVNVIAPGLTETPLTSRMLSSEVGRAAALKQYPMPGINRADDIAETACWLLSDQASRITGQIIAVDGGFSTIRPLVR